MITDGIILDVDGTLWDTTPIVAKAWEKAALSYGVEQEITADILKQQFGKTMKDIADDIFRAQDERTRERLMEKCCELEHEALLGVSEGILYPGVKETILALAKRFRMFIVSNCQSGYIELFMETTGLTGVITDFECYGNTGKPKWDNISLVVERNGLRNPVYVGDTAGDADASRRAGVPFLYAAYGFGQVEEYAARLERFDGLLTQFQ